MNKEFIPYEQALALKELGFDEPCFGYYDNQIKELDTISSEICERLCKHDTHIKAPTFSQAFRWFREKYFIYHEVGIDYDTWDYELYDFKSGNKHIPTGFKTFNTYEEAELACLNKLIEVVKNEK